MRIKMLPAMSGDCIEIIVDKPKPHMIIIDGGMGKICKTILKKDVMDWSDKNGPVDLAILTHVDNDHISGFLTLFSDASFDKNTLSALWFNYGEKIEDHKHFSPLNRIYINSNNCNTSHKQGDELYGLLNAKGIPLVAPVVAGMVKDFDQIRIDVLSPSKEVLEKYVNSKDYQGISDNDIFTSAARKDYDKSIEELVGKKCDESSITTTNMSSIAVIISCDNKKIMCLGDSKASEIEKELRKRGFSEDKPLKLDYIKVAHHGSAHGTSDSLLSIIDCSNYLISANWNGLPSKECLSRIVVNSKRKAVFWCNYEPDINIFSKEEYMKYGMSFKYIKNMEINTDDI